MSVVIQLSTGSKVKHPTLLYSNNAAESHVQIMCFLYTCILVIRTEKWPRILSFADKKYEAIILPMFGIATPFHISTVKVSGFCNAEEDWYFTNLLNLY